jgi:hyperosmotically inducible protein
MITKTRSWAVPALAIAFAIGAAQIIPSAVAEGTLDDNAIQIRVAKSLSNARFKGIKATVQDGTLSLNGTVDIYGVKADAENRVRKIKSVHAVNDEIQVGGPSVPDEVLEHKLLGRIQSDRIGYGTTAFNAIR